MNTQLITKTFQGTPIVFREDGWFNMTKAAKAFGKQLQHFWNAVDTRAYLEAVSHIQGQSSKSDVCTLFVAQRGGASHPRCPSRHHTASTWWAP